VRNLLSADWEKNIKKSSLFLQEEGKIYREEAAPLPWLDEHNSAKISPNEIKRKREIL